MEESPSAETLVESTYSLGTKKRENGSKENPNRLFHRTVPSKERARRQPGVSKRFLSLNTTDTEAVRIRIENISSTTAFEVETI